MKRQYLTRTSQGDHRRRFLDVSAQPMRPKEHPLRPLQRTIGNRAMGRFIQAKLRVRQSVDVYESVCSSERMSFIVRLLSGLTNRKCNRTMTLVAMTTIWNHFLSCREIQKSIS